ncbi:MAG: hypothetical protein D3910_02535 [Candidatus Electrothrix sp. ATG2]|nr:hypothetical protein [Candidatus Electrothrix sp. ATG2]
MQRLINPVYMKVLVTPWSRPMRLSCFVVPPRRGGMNVIIFFILLALLVSAVPLSAASIGSGVCEPYKPLVVQITTQFAHGPPEYGFGFIVGEQYNRLYIVTANHVVRSRLPDKSTEQVLLRFSWDPGGRANQAELLDTMYDPLDLALLRIDKKKILGVNQVNWQRRTWCRSWQVEEKVWFIGRSRKWYVPPDRRAGVLLRTEPDLLGFIHIDIDSVQPGTSGAPLFIQNGLVGMVVNDSPGKTKAVNIDHIRRFVSVENPYPWNFVEHGRHGETSSVTKVRRKEQKDQSAAVVAGSEVFPRTRTTTRNKQVRVVEGVENTTKERKINVTARVPQPLQASQLPVDRKELEAVRPEPPVNRVRQPPPSPPKPGDTLFEPLTQIEFVYLPKGCFQMGSAKKERGRYNNEGPVHDVCVDAFWVGKYEVTLAQWGKVMGKRPHRSQGGARHPATLVTWEEVQGFIRQLNEKTGRMFRLPTEAEWEYAARAGTTTVRYWGDDISCDKAMYENAAKGSCVIDGQEQEGKAVGGPAPVGSFPPNGFDLYDMLGNVWEWCADWYGADYYFSNPKDNPAGPDSGSDRVIRGGSWRDKSRMVRVAGRSWFPPNKRNNFIGFRLVLTE